VSEVREAARRDLDAILSVDARALSGDADGIAYLTQAMEHDAVLVATAGEAVQGCAAVKRQHFYARDFVDVLMVTQRTGSRRSLGPGAGHPAIRDDRVEFAADGTVSEGAG